jgi:serine/threonine protein kinase
MTADRNRAKEIFLEAADLSDEAARTAYLDKACGADAGVRERVEALLRSHDPEGSFLGTPVAVVPDPDHTATCDLATAPDHAAARSSEDEALAFLAPPTRADALGRLGHYEVLQVLGRGGFGIVFRAFDEMLQRVVALKVLAPHIAATSPARKRFLREARSSAQVRHENVVQVHAVAEQPLPYLAMELIPGETLQQRLDRVGPLDVAEVLHIGRQIAEGLAAAHARDLIHRDIKPGNVLLEGGQQKVKITDFGLARTADDASISQSGIIAGTPMYMAPEQALGEPLDQRADLFSLGSVLYQMVTGRPPFRANSTVAVLKRVAEDQPRAIREIIPETPQWLCDIISKLHAKDPDDRYQTAREVADVLADCEAQLKAHSRLKDYSRIPRSQPPRSGRRKWVAAAAVLLLPVVAVAVTELAGVTQLFRGQPTPDVVASPGPQTPPLAIAPFTAADVRRIAAQPAEQQVAEVRKELMRRNPGFAGTVLPTIDGGIVTGLELKSGRVTDLAPVRRLEHLQHLTIQPSAGEGSLVDLSPLKGMKLTDVNLGDNRRLWNLEPLRGMPLETLHLWGWVGSDLTPLQGMPLKMLNCGGGQRKIDLAPLAGMPLDFLCLNHTAVSDLSPLKGLPLTRLMCSSTPVCNLAPLRGMKLRLLSVRNTNVSDLSPLQGLPLVHLEFQDTQVTDLSPLKGMPLKDICLTPKNITKGLDILRDMKSLETIGIEFEQSWPAAEFWERYDKGELK